eukprot:8486972-Ditylum_brightwellii.AAC.1
MSSKFRTTTQRSEESKVLVEEGKQLYKEACEKGGQLKCYILEKLSAKEKEELMNAKKEKWKA